MSYDAWKTDAPDPNDDPYGEHVEEDICPDCGAGPDDPCLPGCGCKYCRARELREREKASA